MANLFDAASAPEGEPSEIVVGDFIQWKRSDLVTDYPTDEYTATYVARITGGGNTEVQVTGTAYNGSYLFTIDSATSADFVAGYYHWQLEILRNSDSERVVVDRGAFTAIVDLDVGGADPRTHAEIMLTKIESLLEGKADSDVSNYSIQGRSLTKFGLDELLQWRDYYNAEVTKQKRLEEIKLGRKTASTVKVRFL
jgi:hypothetical protein